MSNKNPLKSWAWDYFHDSGSKYKGDKTHHEARCLGCIRDHEKVLEDQQRERLELGTLQPDRLKDTAALRKEAIRATEPIRGRVDVMKRHIKKCELVKQAAKDRLAAEEIEKQSDATQEDADSSDHPATARPPGPIQTLFKVAKNKPFTPAAQAEFERDFLKLLIVMNVAMLAANDPYVKHFFEKYVPGARLPDRKQLSNRILDDEVNHVTAAVASDVKGQYATGTVDGWSTKKDAVQCTGLNIGGKEYPGRIHVTTAEQKTSANLLQHVLSDIQWMVATLGIIIVAWCCDSGGDSRGLRPLLVALMPWILAIPCWGHQLNLVVYDYVHRAGDWISETLSKCAIIINWFTSHKRALSMLMEEERRSPEQWTRLKTFIRAVITRWTTHYLSVRRMAELREVLQVLAIVRRSQLLLAGGEKQEQIDAADGVIKIVEDGSFWTNIDVLKRYLEPLAIAANVAQGSSTRLDHVLVTLASLHHAYSTKTKCGEYDRLEDNAIIIASLEKRWAALKRDQDFYIIAVFLHPQFRAHFFDDATHSLSRAGLYTVLKRVYRRVFRVPEDDEMPPGLFESYCQYYDGTGRYTSEGFSLQEWRNEFKRQDTVAFLQNVWRSQPKKDPLAKLALVIVSMIANSAGTERHFSKLGHIYQDKHRSLLAPERAHKIALVNNAVRSEFPRKARAKRAFIAPTPHPEAQTPAVRASEDSEDSDEEDEEARELGAGPALIRELRSLPQDEVPEDVELPYDAAASEGEIQARRARIRIHFGTEELIPLGEIFDFDASESPWGGTLSMYETISKQGVDAQLDLLDAEALGVPEGQNAGSHDAPLVID